MASIKGPSTLTTSRYFFTLTTLCQGVSTGDLPLNFLYSVALSPTNVRTCTPTRTYTPADLATTFFDTLTDRSQFIKTYRY